MGSRGGVSYDCVGGREGREGGRRRRGVRGKRVGGVGVLHAAKPFTPMGGRPARLDGAY